MNYFSHLKINTKEIQQLQKLENDLECFFQTYYVELADENEDKENLRPKGNTANCYKSHLKQKILDLTNQVYDITNKAFFPNFQKFWSGYVKELKAEGRNDTTHNQAIPKTSMTAIFIHLALLLNIMECDKENETEKYKSLIKKLPREYMNDYHRLLQFGAYFIITYFTARRAREGM